MKNKTEMINPVKGNGQCFQYLQVLYKIMKKLERK